MALASHGTKRPFTLAPEGARGTVQFGEILDRVFGDKHWS